MTLAIAVAATLVAVSAAARSTWSPCGLSMLSTVTPISERAKGNSYRSTAMWFVVGATVGGATLGAAMAGLAGVVRSVDPSPTAVGLLAFGAALVAAASDTGIVGLRLPIHRRQVNERWLDQYRPWVYGGGFGWQIGTGLATYITTAAVYLMIVLGALTADPVVALAVGTGFGLLRGLAVLLTRGMTDPSALRRFHRRFQLAGPWASRVVVVVEAGTAIAMVSYVRTPAALAVIGVAVIGVAVIGIAAGGPPAALIAKRPVRIAAPACPLPVAASSPSGPARTAGASDASGSGVPVDLVGLGATSLTD
jgi:hypothetical protein